MGWQNVSTPDIWGAYNRGLEQIGQGIGSGFKEGFDRRYAERERLRLIDEAKRREEEQYQLEQSRARERAGMAREGLRGLLTQTVTSPKTTLSNPPLDINKRYRGVSEMLTPTTTMESRQVTPDIPENLPERVYENAITKRLEEMVTPKERKTEMPYAIEGGHLLNKMSGQTTRLEGSQDDTSHYEVDDAGNVTGFTKAGKTIQLGKYGKTHVPDDKDLYKIVQDTTSPTGWSYKDLRNLGRPLIKGAPKPVERLDWGSLLDEDPAMPPATENTGRIIRDTDTGKRYKSDGKQWIEVK